MDLFVVSKEFYNDYEILAIYDKEENARLFIKQILKETGHTPEINIYPLNPYLQEIKEEKHFYCVKEKKGEFIVSKSNDFSTPIDYKGYKIYKCWAKTPDEAINAIKEGKHES